MTKALDKALSRALAALRRPDAKLVRLHGGTAAGFWVELPHNSFRVPDGVAAKLLVRGDVQPFNSGLPGFDGPQSWKLGGNWREWSQRDPMTPVVSMMPAVVNVTEQTVSRVTTALTDGVGDITQDLLRFKANQFHTALADPPWRFDNRTGKVAPEHRRLRRYPTMTLDEIARAAGRRASRPPTAHLYLWVPNALLPDGLAVMEAWGFAYKAQHRLAQGAQGRRLGRPRRRLLLPQRHRALLFGVRGKNARTLAPGRRQVNIIASRKREHSRKPDEQYALIEACSPGRSSNCSPAPESRAKCSPAGSSNGYGLATRLVRHERPREIAQ